MTGSGLGRTKGAKDKMEEERKGQSGGVPEHLFGHPRGTQVATTGENVEAKSGMCHRRIGEHTGGTKGIVRGWAKKKKAN